MLSLLVPQFEFQKHVHKYKSQHRAIHLPILSLLSPFAFSSFSAPSSSSSSKMPFYQAEVKAVAVAVAIAEPGWTFCDISIENAVDDVTKKFIRHLKLYIAVIQSFVNDNI
jgi:hypothetical protein